MRLFSIELRRLWKRRLTTGGVLVVAAVVILSGVITFFTHRSERPDPLVIDAQLQQQIDQCRQFSINDFQNPPPDEGYRDYISQFATAEDFADEQCRPEYFGLYVEDRRFCLVSLWEPGPTFRQSCPDIDTGTEYQDQGGEYQVRDVTLRYPRSGAGGIIPNASSFLVALAVVIGASAIGGEYRAGTIETLLVWEPRRRRVLAAKFAAAATSTFVIQIGLLALLVIVMLPAGLLRGSTAGVDAEMWRGIAVTALRGGVLASLLSVMAMSVVVVARNTAAGVGVLLGYSAVSPILVNTLIRGFRPFDLSENTLALANGGDVGRYLAIDGEIYTTVAHGTLGALAVVAIYAVVFAVIGTAVFVKRDVD